MDLINPRTAKGMRSKFDGSRCYYCTTPIKLEEGIYYDGGLKKAAHRVCTQLAWNADYGATRNEVGNDPSSWEAKVFIDKEETFSGPFSKALDKVVEWERGLRQSGFSIAPLPSNITYGIGGLHAQKTYGDDAGIHTIHVFLLSQREAADKAKSFEVMKATAREKAKSEIAESVESSPSGIEWIWNPDLQSKDPVKIQEETLRRYCKEAPNPEDPTGPWIWVALKSDDYDLDPGDYPYGRLTNRQIQEMMVPCGNESCKKMVSIRHYTLDDKRKLFLHEALALCEDRTHLLPQKKGGGGGPLSGEPAAGSRPKLKLKPKGGVSPSTSSLSKEPMPAPSTQSGEAFKRLPREDEDPVIAAFAPTPGYVPPQTKVWEEIESLSDGFYTAVFDDGSHKTIRVRTQPQDENFAPGEIIISHLTGPDNESDYTQVAFLKPDGRLIFWKKYRDTEVETNVRKAMQVILQDPEVSGRCYGLMSRKCCVCNATLTHPDSIEAGIGPICAENAWRR